MRFFTADTHFNHLILADIRGFTSAEAHDNSIIAMWNSIVKPKDEIFHLGDFCFGSHKAVRSIRGRLKGKIHLILGNHDRANRLHNMSDTFTSLSDIKEIKIAGHPVILCHYAFRVWSKSHYNSWSLHGHSHGGLVGIGKQYDVGLDANGMRLVSEDDIIHIMESKPNNLNYKERGYR